MIAREVSPDEIMMTSGLVLPVSPPCPDCGGTSHVVGSTICAVRGGVPLCDACATAAGYGVLVALELLDTELLLLSHGYGPTPPAGSVMAPLVALWPAVVEVLADMQDHYADVALDGMRQARALLATEKSA